MFPLQHFRTQLRVKTDESKVEIIRKKIIKYTVPFIRMILIYEFTSKSLDAIFEEALISR